MLEKAGSEPAQLRDGAFSAEELREIRRGIREKYRKVSRTAEGYFKYPTGRKGAAALGYDPGILDQLPDQLLESFCGVGNPFQVAEIRRGSTILDVGCGTGVDLIVAARVTGPEGNVHGVDLSEEMLEKARANMKHLDSTNIEVTHIDSEELPFADASFDVIISNGVINLSPRKPDLFREIRRVCRQGASFQFADIILEGTAPASATVESWSQ